MSFSLAREPLHGVRGEPLQRPAKQPSGEGDPWLEPRSPCEVRTTTRRVGERDRRLVVAQGQSREQPVPESQRWLEGRHLLAGDDGAARLTGQDLDRPEPTWRRLPFAL